MDITKGRRHSSAVLGPKVAPTRCASCLALDRPVVYWGDYTAFHLIVRYITWCVVGRFLSLEGAGLLNPEESLGSHSLQKMKRDICVSLCIYIRDFNGAVPAKLQLFGM